MTIQIVDASTLRPAAYNPRQADPRRLDVVELSLRKLGWLLPIYASHDGEILSGHQRHLVATERLGYTRVPVDFTEPMELDRRKAINIAFNRGTNDLAREDSPKSMTEALERANVIELASALPDQVVDSDAAFRCARTIRRSVADLTTINAGRWKRYSLNLAKSLRDKGKVIMPIVVTPDGMVVNGIGRLEDAAKRGEETVETIVVSPAEAPLADALLNLLSMDFDIHTRYADLLRFNSFRRARMRRSGLGRVFVFAAFPGDYGRNNLHLDDPAKREKWLKFYGKTVLDFGAGHCVDCPIMREHGIDAVEFEPFCIRPGTEVLDLELSRNVTRIFLQRIASGLRFDSIFIGSVFNSVPFWGDREKIITLLAALAGPTTRVYGTAESTNRVGAQIIGGYQTENPRHSELNQFPLDYEPHVSLGDFGKTPKVQRYHTLEEWKRLWAVGFTKLAPKETSQGDLFAIAAGPRPVDPAKLGEAIRFEFDLPHPGDQRLGMADEAIAAFRARGCRVD